MGNEWSLVFFTALAALGTGTFVGVGVSEWTGRIEQIRRPGSIIALIALVASGLSSVTHLGHPERIFGALGHPTSGIFTEALMIGLTGVCVLAYLIAMRKEASRTTRKKITLAGAVPAILLAFAVGDTYVMSSRPAWDTLVLPLVYLGSAAALGCFCLGLLLAAKTASQSFTALRRTTQVVLGLQLVLLVAYLVALAIAPHPEASRSASRVLMGNLAPLFWVGIVLLGWLIPVCLVSLPKTARVQSPATVLCGLVCVFIGAVAFRVMMFNLGTSIWQFFPA